MLNFRIHQPESWEEVAKRIQKEKDPKKVAKLTEELITAIELQVGNPVKKRTHSVKVDQKSRRGETP